MSFSIAGKTAIVTGAASGIGLAVARHFLAQGANVMFADKDEARLLDELGEASGQDEGAGTRRRHFAGDLREKLTLANLLSATIDAFERVDILVNASRQFLPSDPLALEDDSLGQMIGQNLTAGFRLSQIVARRMIAQAREAEDEDAPAGVIVNLTSIAARRSRPGMLGYSVAMAALEQMTRALAVELAPARVRVNALAFASIGSAALQAQLREDPDLRDGIVAGTPLGRIGEASELAELVQFLASDAASFVTGQVLTADGGRSLLDPVPLVAS